jgi:NhaP-type Na+/H+ or K+/H+ antiporter
VHGEFFANPSLTLALAMATGIMAQAVARHVKIPGIVLLLGIGVALGPDGAKWVRPGEMGEALQALVGFAVAVILFEGGLSMRISHLRAQAKPIQRLVTVGAIVTTIGATVVARLFMGWPWKLCFLFGTLVIVTGPTVITPLLRRIRVRRSVSTVLEAEGILIDAVGATIAVVALEVVLAPSGQSIGLALPQVLLRIGGGAMVGLAGGALLAFLLKWRHVVPHGLANTLSLAFAVAIFQISNAIPGLHESGITAAIVAGFVVGNVGSPVLEELVEFKEQLTSLLIATLFVLLAADVRISDVTSLGWEGLATVIGLMIVVRPLTVWASMIGTELSFKEKLFLSWLAPRGIVAAAVASLFAIELAQDDIPGGIEMRALVFLVIAMTVTIQGLSGGFVARLLGLKRASNLGYLFLGAGELALMVARILREAGQTVEFVDSNADSCRSAEKAGFKVYFGNGLEERTLIRAQADARNACVGLTPNESINMLFARTINESFYGPRVFVALESASSGVTEDMVDRHDSKILFAGEAQMGMWSKSLTRERADAEEWVLDFPDEQAKNVVTDVPSNALLPLVCFRAKQVFLVHDEFPVRKGDRLMFAVHADRANEAHEWLRDHGWVPNGIEEESVATDSDPE